MIGPGAAYIDDDLLVLSSKNAKKDAKTWEIPSLTSEGSSARPEITNATLDTDDWKQVFWVNRYVIFNN